MIHCFIGHIKWSRCAGYKHCKRSLTKSVALDSGWVPTVTVDHCLLTLMMKTCHQFVLLFVSIFLVVGTKAELRLKLKK